MDIPAAPKKGTQQKFNVPTQGAKSTRTVTARPLPSAPDEAHGGNSVTLCCAFLFCFVLGFFWDRVSLYGPGWPATHNPILLPRLPSAWITGRHHYTYCVFFNEIIGTANESAYFEALTKSKANWLWKYYVNLNIKNFNSLKLLMKAGLNKDIWRQECTPR
jgi:hypothetical protein